MGIYAKAVEQLARKYLRVDMKVFDCGCGNGFHSMIFKKYADDVIAGDLENRMHPEYFLNFRKISVNNYGIENEFDAVFSLDVIEHVEDDLGFLKEIARITKPGGRIIIGTPNKRRLSSIIRVMLGNKVVYPYRLGYHYESGGEIIHLRGYSMDELERLAQKAAKVKVLEKRTDFFGVYTKFGPIGLKKIKGKMISEYGNHLFIILEKVS